MFNVPHFKEKDEARIYEFMQAHPFITLCGCTKDNLPVATHVPVLFEQRGEKMFLLAHAMRKQQHTLAFEHNPNVLAIFSGAHTYVSASWYEKKNVASTWNYQAVHARGVLRFMNDQQLYDLLVQLTEKFEGNAQSAAQVKYMEKEYVQSNMKAIVGFEIEITSIEHVAKLSQNRDKQSFINIAEQLQAKDADAQVIATEMLKRADEIFKA